VWTGACAFTIFCAIVIGTGTIIVIAFMKYWINRPVVIIVLSNFVYTNPLQSHCLDDTRSLRNYLDADCRGRCDFGDYLKSELLLISLQRLADKGTFFYSYIFLSHSNIPYKIQIPVCRLRTTISTPNYLNS